MINITSNASCCGCGACANICPRGCITMEPDAEGFLYPQVDSQSCIQCGLCQKVCPMAATTCTSSFPREVYAVINRDHEIRKNSSSGGIFTAIAQHILQQNGVVFGACITQDMTVRHIAIEDPRQLHKLQGSKYVQSAIGNTYAQAKDYLNQGRPVLFTGTPCQISGLQCYLGKDYDNLLCQDLICHGAPSPSVWRQYVSYREAYAESKATSVFFRYKDPSWVKFCMRFEFENGSIYQAPLQQDPFLRAFLADLCLRPSCHACAFKGLNRPADITLADYWGVWDVHPDLHDDKGTSLVFVHTEKGKALLDAVQDSLRTIPTQTQAALVQNPAMVHSAAKPKNRESFIYAIQNGNFEHVVDHFCPKPTRAKILLQKIKRRLKQILK